ncbi:MAG: PD-(D/E)XK nuclease family protein [Parcubacteria group bacterium]|nr:PD-(D/E)XK nuclease family protein [Parcubacteria group bacterium]
MIKISPSLIGILSECPRCLWLHFHEDIKRPQGIFPSLPSGMDGVLKTYFDGYRSKKKLPPEVDGKVDGVLFTDRAKLDGWRNNFKGIQAKVPEFDMLIKGAIDELLVDSEGRFIPFDFKTRGFPTKEDTHEHYQFQLDLYAFLFDKNGFPVADHGYLLFFWPEDYREGVARFTTDLIKLKISPAQGYEVLTRVHAILSGPKPSAHEECQYCAYREVALGDTNL